MWNIVSSVNTKYKCKQRTDLSSSPVHRLGYWEIKCMLPLECTLCKLWWTSAAWLWVLAGMGGPRPRPSTCCSWPATSASPSSRGTQTTRASRRWTGGRRRYNGKCQIYTFQKIRNFMNDKYLLSPRTFQKVLYFTNSRLARIKLTKLQTL